MVSLLRVKARWTGFNGAPGYTVLHFGDFGAEGAAAAIAAAGRARTFFAAIGNRLPNNVRINIEPDVEVIESTTDTLVAAFPAGTNAEVQGAGGTAFAGPVGAVVNWNTAGIRNGRRVRGRTFLVPAASASFGVDGLLLPVARTSILDAATALANGTGSPDLFVFGRPTTGGADGVAFAVNGASVPAMAAVLRSRRD